MAETSVPRTPSPAAPHSKAFTSLTPPPTTQAQRYSAPPHRRRTANRIPTLEEARGFTAEECQSLVLELLPLLGETRMELAHTKLQLQLLSISSNEAAQRAEVEHEMTRREAEVLRACSPVLRGRSATMQDHSPFYQVQRQLEIAIEAGHDLESENTQLKQKLRQAKRIIKHLDGQKTQLSEDNQLLRERIKQNRAHTDAKSSTDQSPAFTPRGRNPRRPSPPAPLIAPQAQNPLDALLMADQILSADPSSMPATPSPLHPRHRAQGHIRGAQSLSSLPSTPTRMRRLSANTLLATPTNRVIYQGHDTARYTAPAGVILRGEKRALNRKDRDGTISATDDEALTDDDEVTTSRASQVAGGMLLKNVKGGNSGGVGSTSGAQYPWMTIGRGDAPDVKESERPRKKVKASQQGKGGIGLGIKPWDSPAR